MQNYSQLITRGVIDDRVFSESAIVENCASWLVDRIAEAAVAQGSPFTEWEILTLGTGYDQSDEAQYQAARRLEAHAVVVARNALTAAKQGGVKVTAVRRGLTVPLPWELCYEVVYMTNWPVFVSHVMQSAFMGSPTMGERKPWRSVGGVDAAEADYVYLRAQYESFVPKTVVEVAAAPAVYETTWTPDELADAQKGLEAFAGLIDYAAEEALHFPWTERPGSRSIENPQTIDFDVPEGNSVELHRYSDTWEVTWQAGDLEGEFMVIDDEHPQRVIHALDRQLLETAEELEAEGSRAATLLRDLWLRFSSAYDRDDLSFHRPSPWVLESLQQEAMDADAFRALNLYVEENGMQLPWRAANDGFYDKYDFGVVDGLKIWLISRGASWQFEWRSRKRKWDSGVIVAYSSSTPQQVIDGARLGFDELISQLEAAASPKASAVRELKDRFELASDWAKQTNRGRAFWAAAKNWTPDDDDNPDGT